MESYDIFAETNPAFCAVTLFKFCDGYEKESGNAVDYPLIFLALPIILSSELNNNFQNTQVNTGLYRWVERTPELLIGLSELVQETVDYTKSAIQFGVAKKVLGVNGQGQFFAITEGISIKPSELTPYTKMAFNNSFRFGQWLGQVDSTVTIFNFLGLSYE